MFAMLWAGVMSKDAVVSQHGSECADVRSVTESSVAHETDPAKLVALACHGDEKIRATVASNEAMPLIGLVLLTGDSDISVRAAALPRLEARVTEVGKLAGGTFRISVLAALEELIVSGAEDVRWQLCEAVAACPGAPPELVLRLARSQVDRTSELMLKFAISLSDDDILSIFELYPTRGRLTAVAGRPGCSERLSTAIVSSRDSSAITALLRNASAQIREETLGEIIDLSRSHLAWHQPLAVHPRLTPRLLRRLCAIVTDDVLGLLARRDDLDTDTSSYLRNYLAARVAESARAEFRQEVIFDTALFGIAFARAESLHEKGQLTDSVVMKSAVSKITPFTLAALAVRAALSADEISLAFTGGLPADIVAICWLAGLSAVDAERLQDRCTGIRPDDVVRATNSGWYKSSEAQLMSSIESLRRRAAGSKVTANDLTES